MGVRVSLIYRPINKGDIRFPITPRQTSAIVELYEVVRDLENGQQVIGMEMNSEQDAQSRLQDLANRLSATHSLTDFECIQRLGYVPAGEATVCIRTAAPERHQALKAADEFAHELREMGVIRREPKV